MSQLFGNKIFVEPSSSARIITDVSPSPNLLSSGVVAVIGESAGGLTMADSIVYSSTNPSYFRRLLKSGDSLKCINLIFNPSIQYGGAQKVYFIRTQKATVATRTVEQSTGGSVTIVFTTKDKGVYLSDADNGMKLKLIDGIVDTNKTILSVQLNQETIWNSPEVTTFKELVDAIDADEFASTILSAEVTVGTDTTTIDDSVYDGDWVLMTGGTSPTMVGDDVDDALALLQGISDISHIFIASEDATLHAKVASYVNNSAPFPTQAYFGGAVNETVAEVKARALALNDENNMLAYPDVLLPKDDGSGSEKKSPMYLASIACGLKAGGAPEQPITWKSINVLGFATNESEPDETVRGELIKAGVSYFRNVPGIGYACNKGVNTLQTNGSMIYKKTNGEATSPELSLISIKNQLIRELIVNSAPLFIGGTIATVSEEDVVNFTVSYLRARTSTFDQSNLLIGFQNVTAELRDDAWFVYFGFTPNTPVNHVFFTGAMLRP